MNTLADARALGFETPIGDDFMSAGDDAIRENARVTAELFAARSFSRGRPPLGSDAFKLADGAWTISSVAHAAGVSNLPEDVPGTLVTVGAAEPLVKAARFEPYNTDYEWRTVSSTQGTWMPWIKTGTASAAYAANQIHQARMVHHYGPIDTAGLGAVAWRIDHGWANFKTKILPIFRAAGIVPMVTYNPRDWSRGENAGVTTTEVNQWVADGWIEISNHGATHADAASNDLADYVAGSLAEIEQQLPASAGKVFGFHVAGVGGDAFDGFQGGATAENWDTAMGRLILKHHAFGSGYVPDTALRVLDGTIRQGLAHLTTDSRTAAEVTAEIDAAIATGRGLQIMSHPSNLDTAGMHTTAMIQQIVDHIVSKRDTGQLAVLSPYQMMLADSTRPAVQVEDVPGLAARLAILEPKDLGTVHLDTVRALGPYYQPFASRATKAQGYPWEGVAGNLTVEAWNPPAGNLIVVFKSWDRGTAKRTLYNGTWRPWLDFNGNPIP